MEHVPLPAKVTSHLVKTPLFTKKEWDWKDFITYPDRTGWRDAISRRSWGQDPTPFVRTWLFFGLVSTIVGRKATFGEFTTHDESGEAIISTKSLKNREKWQIQPNERGYPMTGLMKAIVCLKAAKSAFFTFVQSNCGYEMDAKLALSISTVAEFLCNLVFREYQHLVPIDKADGPAFSTKFALKPDTWNVEHLTPEEISKSYAKFSSFTSQDWAHKNGDSYSCKKMHSEEWCLKKAVRCLIDFNATTNYYVSYFDNPSPGKDHTRCTSTYCPVNNLDDESYETAHAKSSCSCNHIGPTDADLSSILAEKTFPLIIFSDHLDDNTNLPLQEFRPGTRYIAISHVWSDRLGNPSANSLPRCQLSRLSKSIRQLCGHASSPEIPFWVDTICCPYQPGDAQDLAILKMRDTYALAEWVLVLDAWLTSQGIGGLSDVEILLKIACSNWNERLWTLQEGILAKKLAFQFRDAIYQDLESAVHKIWRKTELADYCLRATLLNQYDHLYGLENMENAEPGEKLLALRDTLKFRGTSVPSDEALCLGNLLGFEMESIVQAPKEHKIRVFWSKFSKIPTQYIFGGAKRLSQEGYSWAPETLRDPLTEGPQMLQAPFCTPILRSNKSTASPRHIKGLQIQGPGFLLDAHRYSLWNIFHFFDQKENLYAAEFDPILPGVPFETFETSSLDLGKERGRQRRIDPWYGISKQSTNCIALICVYIPDSNGTIPVQDFYNAILVTVLRQKKGLLITKFVRPVRLSYDKNEENINPAMGLLNISALKEGPSHVVLEEGSISIIEGARLLRNQDWHIL